MPNEIDQIKMQAMIDNLLKDAGFVSENFEAGLREYVNYSLTAFTLVGALSERNAQLEKIIQSMDARIKALES